MLFRSRDGGEQCDVRAGEPGIGRELDLHGDGVEVGRGNRKSVEQRGSIDSALLGDGRCRKYYGDVHGHGGDDCQRSDGNHHGRAERKDGNGNHHAGDSDGGEHADVRAGEPGIGRELDLHGNGVEDGRGDSNAVEQRGGIDSALLGDGSCRKYYGDVHGHGGDDR